MVEVLTMKEWENLPIAREYRDKVIEECAKVAFEAAGSLEDRKLIAAAIRALKEKP